MGPRVWECTIRPLLSKSMRTPRVAQGECCGRQRERRGTKLRPGILPEGWRRPCNISRQAPGQIAYGNALRSQLAKRANRLAPQRHLVGTRLLERERERFRVVGKAARPKTFSLVNWKIALAFEKRQGFPPGHESGHSFAPHAARPTRSCAREAPSRGGVNGAESCAFKHESGKGSGSGHPRRIVSRSRCRIPLTAPSHVQAARSATWSRRLRSF